MSRLLDLLYPPKCAFCRKLVPTRRMLCSDCEKHLPAPCAEEQLFHIQGLDACFAPFYYSGTVRDSLLRYKFHGAAAYAKIYGELMAACASNKGTMADLVTWVPLSRQRLRKRGYDQAELLARAVSDELHLPCRRLLRKIRHNHAQSGTGSAEERRQNVKDVYREEQRLNGERILLIDDIITTGATIAAAAEILRQAGAGTVIGLSLARKSLELNGDRDDADI